VVATAFLDTCVLLPPTLCDTVLRLAEADLFVQQLIASMTCEAKDRHVLAAAVRAESSVVVTFNVRDFPTASVTSWDVTVVHPDDFLLDLADRQPGVVLTAVRHQSVAYRRPTMSVDEILERLSRTGLQRKARKLRDLA
jgi:hypothetical protein